MNFLVYEMDSIKNLRGEEREWVNSLIERLRNQPVQPGSPRVPFFEAIGRGYFKKRSGLKRLIAFREDVRTSHGIAPVVIFLELISRTDPHYEDGKAERLSQRYSDLISNHRSRLSRWTEEQLRQQKQILTHSLPEMPESLNTLLQRIPIDEKGAGIFHSEFWNSQFRQASSLIKGQLYHALNKIIGESHEKWQKYESTCNSVSVHYVTLPDPHDNTYHYYLLGFITSSWTPIEIDNSKHRIEENWHRFEEEVILPLQIEFEKSQSSSSKSKQFIDHISRFSSCAYPIYLLADEELWEKLVTTDSTLLPLSSEELDALEQLSSGERFPGIIEGRAGSGKTTLLCCYVPQRLVRLPHLVAKPENGHRLLYLAENPRLLDNAEKIIDTLKNKLKEEYCSSMSMWLHEEYKTFHDYALGQLPMERRSRFLNIGGNHISYFRFRSLLRDPQHGLRVKLSRAVQNPEILWFVIRSYIKGFNLDAEGDDRWMTPEQFATEEELNRRDRQVSQQVYNEIWDQVWPWYKRLTIPCRENNYTPPYWDNLDLAWEVLDSRWSEAPKYAVLICDEVQDLTRVELAAIFQSSEYLKYDRDPNQASRVPIILAGDSYQTINPACFRWARVKADCAKALVQQVPNAPPPRIEPFQLVYNYRNRPSIARLCNALQRLREIIVGEAGELQRIWQPQDLPLNQAVRQLIIAEDGAILRNLFLKGVLFLGPEPLPAFGDEASDAFWKALGLPKGPPHATSLRKSPPESGSQHHKATDNDIVQTVSYDCPADVKGLEKPFYALLGFGTAFAQLDLKRFWEWNNHTRDTIPEANILAAEYFLNRLYVAASRAREQLWIVETEAGWNAFWKPLKEWVDQIKSASNSDCNSPEHESISFEWSPASADELVAVFQKEWPTLAKDYEEQAEVDNNPEFAERAAYYYRLTNDALGEARSRALHRYLEGKLDDAVEILIKIDRDKACKWAWEAAAWETLLRTEFKSTWQYQLAELMRVAPTDRGSFWINKLVQIIDTKHNIISEDIAHSRKSCRTWSVMITELLECAAQGQFDEQVISEAQRIGRLWQNSPHHDFKRYYKALGLIEYKLRCYPEAVSSWEKALHTQNQDYYLAKAKVSPYPNNLQYLESAQQWQEILLQEEIHRGQSLSAQDSRRVLRACRELRRWRQAVGIATSLENRDFVELWAHIIADPTVTLADLRDYIRDAHESWRKLNRESDNDDRARSWSLLMTDSLLYFHDHRMENQHANIEPLLYEPFFYGLKWECDVRRIAGLFRRAHDNRQERTRWDVYEALLKRIGSAGLTYARQAWDHDRSEEAATIAYLLCGLIWDTTERTEDTEFGGWFDRLAPYPYTARIFVDGYPPTSPIGYDLLDDINPSFLELAHSALRTIAEAPAELFRKLLSSHWRDLHDLIDGIAYLFYNKVRDRLATAPELTLLQQTEQFLLVGRVCEQAHFRKLAVRYYETLAQATDRITFPDDFRRTVLERLERARQAQREYRELRDTGQEEVFVRPGENGKSPTLMVRSLFQRPEVILELLPDTDSYQVRFTVASDRRGKPTAIPPVSILGPRGSHQDEWQIRIPSGEMYRLIWQKAEGRLRIEAPDRIFIVEVNLRQS